MGRKTHRSGITHGICALALCLPLATLANDPVAQARQQCASYKQLVRTLERGDSPETELTQARRNWELACFRAHALLTDKEPPLPPMAVPPVSLRIASRVQTPTRPARPEPRSRSRFKVTVLDPMEEALRLEPPRTQAASPAPAVGQPVPLF